MLEAVRTYASPAAIWTIVVIASSLALFMAMATLAANHYQIREHRRMRKFGIRSFVGDELEMEINRAWPSLSEALFDAAGARSPAAMGAAAWTQAGYTAAGHAGQPEAEPPTVPIPAQRAPASQETSAGEAPTSPDLLAEEAPRRRAVPMPAQRTGESDRAERSLAGPAPQDDDKDEQ
jgi:hypothetical protein